METIAQLVLILIGISLTCLFLDISGLIRLILRIAVRHEDNKKRLRKLFKNFFLIHLFTLSRSVVVKRLLEISTSIEECRDIKNLIFMERIHRKNHLLKEIVQRAIELCVTLNDAYEGHLYFRRAFQDKWNELSAIRLYEATTINEILRIRHILSPYTERAVKQKLMTLSLQKIDQANSIREIRKTFQRVQRAHYGAKINALKKWIGICKTTMELEKVYGKIPKDQMGLRRIALKKWVRLSKSVEELLVVYEKAVVANDQEAKYMCKNKILALAKK